MSAGPRPRRPALGSALRSALAAGYGRADLTADLAAGAVVGTVAVPLSMALAIACGAPPQHGLYTAIVAGAVTALAGGSRYQVSGPTAAFVVLLAPITATWGLAGLALASAMAGLILLGMGWGRLGRLIEFVPYPVTTGFTAGIALVIASLQITDFLGLEATPSSHFLPRLAALGAALDTWRPGDAAVGAATLAILFAWPRLPPRLGGRLPAPLVALALGAVLAALVAPWLGGTPPATLADRFEWTVGAGTAAERSGRGVPPLPPHPTLPWDLPGPGGEPLDLDFELVRDLLPSAFAIAMLGAIESLLSAVVADGLAGTRHDPDGELLAQGLGNAIAPFFGGFAATGALARTATNVRSGARTPLAAVFHAGFVLLAVVAMAPLLGYLPMAALAALLLSVAWRMAEAHHVVRVTRSAPASDVLVLWVCLGLTVVFDMVVAVSVGIVLAALLFMRRMAAVAELRLVGEAHRLPPDLPPGILVYEVQGPLFFGAVHRAMAALERIAAEARVVVLDLREVSTLDATAAVNLESTLERLHARGVFVVLAGVRREPRRVLLRSGFRNRPGQLALRRDLASGLAAARAHLELPAAPLADVPA